MTRHCAIEDARNRAAAATLREKMFPGSHRQPALRSCITCKKQIKSEHAGHRMCVECRLFASREGNGLA